MKSLALQLTIKESNESCIFIYTVDKRGKMNEICTGAICIKPAIEYCCWLLFSDYSSLLLSTTPYQTVATRLTKLTKLEMPCTRPNFLFRASISLE